MSLKDDFDARWAFPTSLMTAGIATNRGDPSGALGEALAAGALWLDPSEDVIEWLSWARHLVSGWSVGWAREHGPAVGSMPVRANGVRVKSNIIDLAIPWDRVVAAVPSLRHFSQERQEDRQRWNAAGRAGDHTLARVQVKTRFDPDPSTQQPYDACEYGRYLGFAEDQPPALDLFVFVLLARSDDQRRLDGCNFVYGSVVITEPALERLNPHKPSVKLRWTEVRGWLNGHVPLPAGVVDLTSALRVVEIPSW